MYEEFLTRVYEETLEEVKWKPKDSFDTENVVLSVAKEVIRDLSKEFMQLAKKNKANAASMVEESLITGRPPQIRWKQADDRRGDNA